MSVSTKHSLYDAFLPDWRLMRDVTAGQRQVKNKRTIYLPMPAGMTAQQTAAENKNILGPYDNYLARARFPDWLNALIIGMVGLVFEKEPVIELPARLEPLRENVNLNGEALITFMKRALSETLLTGRYGIATNISNGDPYLAGYCAENVINWAEVDGDVVLVVVVEEKMTQGGSKYVYTPEPVYFVLELEEGRYKASSVNVIDGNELEEPAETPKLDSIPFVFCGSLDLLPGPDVIPLLSAAHCAVEYYQLHADYRQALWYTSAPQYSLYGVDNEDRPAAQGAGVLWNFPNPESHGEILEFTGQGIGAIVTAMDRAKNEAYENGARVMEKQQAQESGFFREQSRQDRQVSLKTSASTVAEGVERALKYAAEMQGANPDDVHIELNTDYTAADIDAVLLKSLVDAISLQVLPAQVLYNKLRLSGLTDLDDDEIMEMIEANAGRALE